MYHANVMNVLLESFTYAQEIISYPPTHLLTDDDKTLIWSFRYYLTQDNKVQEECTNILEYFQVVDNLKALPKFLQCVDWNSTQEVDEVFLVHVTSDTSHFTHTLLHKHAQYILMQINTCTHNKHTQTDKHTTQLLSFQALSLMERWQPMDSQEALELLTSRFFHPMVKKYAICQLEQADNEVDHTIVILHVFHTFLRNCSCIYYSWYKRYAMTLKRVSQKWVKMTCQHQASLPMKHLVTQVTS